MLKPPAPILRIEALDLMRRLEGGHFVTFDLVEGPPAVDPSRTTAALAANIAYEFMTFAVLQKWAAATGLVTTKPPDAHGHAFGVPARLRTDVIGPVQQDVMGDPFLQSNEISR